MLHMKGRRVDRCLQVHAVYRVAKEERRRPLVLLITPWRAERHVRFPVTQRERGQTMSEYAIVLAVISIAIIAAISLLGTNISKALSGVASKV